MICNLSKGFQNSTLDTVIIVFAARQKLWHVATGGNSYLNLLGVKSTVFLLNLPVAVLRM